MLERLVNTFIAALELLEAEAGRLKCVVVRTAGDAAAIVGLLAAIAVGLLVVLVGCTWLLAEIIGVPLALVAVGVLMTTAAAVPASIIYRKASRDRNQTPESKHEQRHADPRPPAGPPAAAPTTNGELHHRGRPQPVA